jgi:hypothetical protein
MQENKETFFQQIRLLTVIWLFKKKNERGVGGGLGTFIPTLPTYTFLRRN